MQYLLTQEEFDARSDEGKIEKFKREYAEYSIRKNNHFQNCMANEVGEWMKHRSHENPINKAKERHEREFTEKPPE